MNETMLEKLDASANGRREARRRAMLVAALELFTEKGYGATSLSEVVKRSGGSLSTLYDLFGNKAGLFRAIVEHRCSQVTEHLTAPDIMDRPVEEALSSFAYNLVHHTLDDQTVADMRAIVAECGQFPALGEMLFESGPERGQALMAEYLGEQTRRGRIKTENPRQAAEDFCALVCGEARFRALFGLPSGYNQDTIKPRIDHAVRVFLKAYA